MMGRFQPGFFALADEASDFAFVGITAFTNNTTSYTVSDVDIGGAAASRLVAVAVAFEAGTGTASVSSVTIGGVTATNIVTLVETDDNKMGVAVYAATVPTGETADIVITFGTTTLRCVVGV